jgi:hypothetical protein
MKCRVIIVGVVVLIAACVGSAIILDHATRGDPEELRRLEQERIALKAESIRLRNEFESLPSSPVYPRSGPPPTGRFDGGVPPLMCGPGKDRDGLVCY